MIFDILMSYSLNQTLGCKPAAVYRPPKYNKKNSSISVLSAHEGILSGLWSIGEKRQKHDLGILTYFTLAVDGIWPVSRITLFWTRELLVSVWCPAVSLLLHHRRIKGVYF